MGGLGPRNYVSTRVSLVSRDVLTGLKSTVLPSTRLVLVPKKENALIPQD